MKNLRILITAILLCSLLSSCAAMKKRKCDCPKFSEQTIPAQNQDIPC
ncbi:MAG: hypothetical protein IPM47_05815 [Sphingobacteriales bacterium]|nr:MAG: hypothetical protein IPM47_05815 [Sphingobacteriales bacterium]